MVRQTPQRQAPRVGDITFAGPGGDADAFDFEVRAETGTVPAAGPGPSTAVAVGNVSVLLVALPRSACRALQRV
jgi:hypothetical protein